MHPSDSERSMMTNTMISWRWRLTWIATGAIAIAARALMLGNGRVPVDDAMITLRYAWNLAHHGRWFFNFPEEASQGASSLLWVLILAPVSLLLDAGDIRAIPVLAVLGVLLQLGAVLVFITGAIRIAHRRWQWTLAAILFALSPTLLDQALNGMETSAAALFIAFAAISTPGTPRWALALGLLALTRPETAVTVLVPLFTVYGVGALRRNRRELGMWLKAASIVMTVGAIGLTSVAALRGWMNPLPTTLEAKNVTYDLLCGQQPFASRFGIISALVGTSMATAPWAFGVILALAISGLIVWRNITDNEPLDLWAWGLAWIATITFQIGVVRWSFPWYPAVGGFIALLLVARAFPSRGQAKAVAAMAFIILAMTLIDGYKGRQFTASSLARYFDSETYERHPYVKTGVTLKGIAPKGARVMLEPAGWVPFFSGLHSDDAIGLISDAVPLARTSSGCWYDDAVDKLKPDFIVLRAGEIRHNKNYICGWQSRLSCRNTPVPREYGLLVSDDPSESDLSLVILSRRQGERGR